MRWYPWYFDDYERDTRHLTLAEHGAYRILLDCYMKEETALPDNDRALARIVGAGLDEWLSVAAAVRPFFKARDGELIHKRCEDELRAQRLRSRNRTEIAKKAAFARYSRINGIRASSMREACIQPATSYKESISLTSTSSVSGSEVASEKEEKLGVASPELADVMTRKGWRP